jgi:hypothetical protein
MVDCPDSVMLWIGSDVCEVGSGVLVTPEGVEVELNPVEIEKKIVNIYNVSASSYQRFSGGNSTCLVTGMLPARTLLASI